MTQLGLFAQAAPVVPPPPAAGETDGDWWISPSGFHHHRTADVMLIPNVATDGISDAPGFTIVLFSAGRVSDRVEVRLDVGGARAESLRLSTAPPSSLRPPGAPRV